jgi:hypothetical protein
MSTLRPFILNLRHDLAARRTTPRAMGNVGQPSIICDNAEQLFEPVASGEHYDQALGVRATCDAMTPSLRYQPSTAAVSGEGQHVAPLDPTAEGDITLRIGALNLKNRLRDIETKCRNRLHDLAPPNRGRLNGTHTRGTHVPVEEPSTASDTDICDGADHWIFAGD